jgi:hypothetical protein
MWRAPRICAPEPSVTVDTGAGVKTLDLVARDAARFTFRAAMGHPEELREADLVAAGETVRASVLRMGNPQCVVLGALAVERALQPSRPGAVDTRGVSGRHQRRVRPRGSARIACAS